MQAISAINGISNIAALVQLAHTASTSGVTIPKTHAHTAGSTSVHGHSAHGVTNPKDTVHLGEHVETGIPSSRQMREALAHVKPASHDWKSGAHRTAQAAEAPPPARPSASRAQLVKTVGGGRPSFSLRTTIGKSLEAMLPDMKWAPTNRRTWFTRPQPSAVKTVGGQGTWKKPLERPTPTVNESVGGWARVGRGVLGVAGMALSALQIKEGAAQVVQGDTANGIANMGMGTTNGAASVYALGGRLVAAGRLGGASALIDGANDVYQGRTSGQSWRVAEGGLKTGAGALMLSGTAAAAPAAVGYFGYSATRALMSAHLGEGPSGDERVTANLDLAFNEGENHEKEALDSRNHHYAAETCGLERLSAEQIRDRGEDRHAVTRAILGAQQEGEDARARGSAEDAHYAEVRVDQLRAAQRRVNDVYGQSPRN